jgi:hypothetical protein
VSGGLGRDRHSGASERDLLERWIQNWSDMVDIEVYPVLSSKEAAEEVAPRL